MYLLYIMCSMYFFFSYRTTDIHIILNKIKILNCFPRDSYMHPLWPCQPTKFHNYSTRHNKGRAIYGKPCSENCILMVDEYGRLHVCCNGWAMQAEEFFFGIKWNLFGMNRKSFFLNIFFYERIKNVFYASNEDEDRTM